MTNFDFNIIGIKKIMNKNICNLPFACRTCINYVLKLPVLFWSTTFTLMTVIPFLR